MTAPSSTASGIASTDPDEGAQGGAVDDRITPLETVTIGYALWTIAFLLSLWAGRGWALALPLFLTGSAACVVAARRNPVDRPDSQRLSVGSGAGVVVAAVLAFGWLLEPLGSLAMPLLAVVALGVLVALDRGAESSESPQRLWLALSAATAVACAHALDWTLFTVAMTVVVVVAVAAEVRGQSVDAGPVSARRRSEVSVLAVGLMLGAWTMFTRQFNPDDSYYANKAAHYAKSASEFFVANQQFGTLDEPHVPLADILSSYEPLAGVISAVTGVHHATVMYLILAPAIASFIPAAHRYAAQAFGVRRPDMVALVAVAAIVHLQGYGDFILLIDKIFQGKGGLVLVALPVLTGACIRYWAHPTTRRLLVAVAAMVAAVGMTPTAGAPALGAGLAILAAGLFVTRSDPRFGARERLRGVVPAACVFGYAVFAFWFQSNASQTNPEFLRFAGPESAWARRLLIARADQVIGWNVPGFLTMFAVVLVILVGRTSMQRAFFGVVSLGLFTLLFNPLFFSPVFDEILHLNFLAWRFGWILPTSLAIGLAVDAVDRPLPVVGTRLGSLILGLLIVSGLPLLARTDQEYPAPWDLQNRWIRGAEITIEATPPGGRYLAHERIEVAATILSADVYPTYARQIFLSSHERGGASAEFNVELRNELARQIKGRAPLSDTMEALDTLRIDTVCIDPRIDPADYPLLEALPSKFEPGESVRLCEVWTRVVPAG